MDQTGHLRPLSRYAVELSNRCKRKRCLSSVGGQDETPGRRLFSPDLSCVLDHLYPPEKRTRTHSEVFSQTPIQTPIQTPKMEFNFWVENMFSRSPLESEEDAGYGSGHFRGSEPRGRAPASSSTSVDSWHNLEDEEMLDFGLPLFESTVQIPRSPGRDPTEALTFDSLEGAQLLLEKVDSVLMPSEQESPQSRKVLSEVQTVNPAEVPPVRPPRRNGVVNFKTEEEWNVAKKKYTNSVYSHVNASKEMDELNHLSRYVAEQASGQQWQHPADLSRRNYARRFEARTAKTTLAEWSSSTEKRFKNVPRFFNRSRVL